MSINVNANVNQRKFNQFLFEGLDVRLDGSVGEGERNDLPRRLPEDQGGRKVHKSSLVKIWSISNFET